MLFARHSSLFFLRKYVLQGIIPTANLVQRESSGQILSPNVVLPKYMSSGDFLRFMWRSCRSCVLDSGAELQPPSAPVLSNPTCGQEIICELTPQNLLRSLPSVEGNLESMATGTGGPISDWKWARCLLARWLDAGLSFRRSDGAAVGLGDGIAPEHAGG